MKTLSKFIQEALVNKHTITKQLDKNDLKKYVVYAYCIDNDEKEHYWMLSTSNNLKEIGGIENRAKYKYNWDVDNDIQDALYDTLADAIGRKLSDNCLIYSAEVSNEFLKYISEDDSVIDYSLLNIKK